MREAFYKHISSYIGGQPWYIRPEMLDLIHDVLAVHSRGDESEIEKLKKDAAESLGRDLGKILQPYVLACKGGCWGVDEPSAGQGADVEGGAARVAVIPLHGVIGKRMNLFTEISGGVSTELVRRSIQESVDDDEIDGILLDIESPGGAMDGTKELSDFIYGLRGGKPIVSLANGQMASAALYIGSASDKVFATPSAQVGSIGVFMRHAEMSEALKNEGVKVNYIRSKKFKGTPNAHEPLSEEVRAYMQGLVDEAYRQFVDDVTLYRDAERGTVEQDWADGRVFSAQTAVAMGMVDDIATFEGALDEVVRMSGAEYRMATPISKDEAIGG